MLTDFSQMTTARSRRLLAAWREQMPRAAQAIRDIVPEVFGRSGPSRDCSALSKVIVALSGIGGSNDGWPDTADSVPYLDNASFAFDEEAAFAVDLLVLWYADMLRASLPDAELAVADAGSRVAPKNAWVVRSGDLELALFDVVEVWLQQRADGDGDGDAAQRFADSICSRLQLTGATVSSAAPVTKMDIEGTARSFTLGEALGATTRSDRVKPVPGWQVTRQPEGPGLANVRISQDGTHAQVLIDSERVYVQHPSDPESVLVEALLQRPVVDDARAEDREVYTLELAQILTAEQLAGEVHAAMVEANQRLRAARPRRSWFR